MPVTTCPGCGQALTAVDTSTRPETAPWLCATCARGWWNAELAAREAWDANLRSFDVDNPVVLEAAEAERDQAVEAADPVLDERIASAEMN